MDIKQALICTALISVGKDLTYRDYAQGAYRMRGIGKGQKLEIVVPGEVLALMYRDLEKVGYEALSFQTDLLVWLTLQNIKYEEKQFSLLQQQNLRNVWKAKAQQNLVYNSPVANPGPCCKGENTKVLELQTYLVEDGLLSTYVMTDFISSGISNSLKSSEKRVEKLGREMEEYKDLLTKTEVGRCREMLGKMEDVGKELGAIQEAESEKRSTRENENEQENEEENEEEREIENEEHVETHRSVISWNRPTDEVLRWKLADLQNAFLDDKQVAESFLGKFGFLPLSKYQPKEVSRFSLGQKEQKPLIFPSDIYFSQNFYKEASHPQRLRNVLYILDWVPDKTKQMERQNVALSEKNEQDMKDALQKCFALMDLDGDSMLTRSEITPIQGTLAKETYSLQEFTKEIVENGFFKPQANRFFVLLSLEEAEHLRGASHILNRDYNLYGSSAWRLLQLPALRNSGTDNLDGWETKKRCEGAFLSENQQHTAEQIARFVNAESGYTEREFFFLTNALQQTCLESRKSFWKNVSKSRRRSHSVERLQEFFTTRKPLQALQVQLLLRRLKVELYRFRLSAAQILEDFGSEDGILTKLDFVIFMQAVCTEVEKELILLAFEALDQDKSNALDKEELVEVLNVCPAETKQYDKLVRRKYYATPEKRSAKENVWQPRARGEGSCKATVVRVHSSDWTKVWSTKDKNLSLKEPLTVFKPSLLKADQIYFGHLIFPVATNNLSFIKDKDIYKKDKPVVLSIGGKPICNFFPRKTRNSPGKGENPQENLSQKEVLKSFLGQKAFPKPSSYSLVYSIDLVHFYLPISNDPHFVALGLVVTTDGKPPQKDEPRLYPQRWLGGSQQRGQEYWKATGGLQPASFYKSKAGFLKLVKKEGQVVIDNNVLDWQNSFKFVPPACTSAS